MTAHTRHPDFEEIYAGFQRSRNGIPAQMLYSRFIEAYELDDRKPYSVGAQVRLQALALRSPMHLSIKREYPEIDWDQLITGEAKLPAPKKVRRAPKKRKGRTIEVDLYDLQMIESIIIDGQEVKIV